jgi:hypothetical protein
MSVCVHSVFVFSCVGSGFQRADPPFKESYQLSNKVHNFRINLEWEQTRDSNPST